MENYPSNSKQPRRPDDAGKPESRLSPVVTGQVSRQKKSLGRRFRETFIGGTDAQTVWSYVAFNVLVPAAKDMLADAASQGVERMLFGDSYSPRRRGGGFQGPTNNTVVNYSGMSSRSRLVPQNNDPRTPLSRPVRRQHDFDDFLLPTRVEADAVIEGLSHVLERYGQASVSDLYDLLNITGDYTDEKWGWSDLRTARVTRVHNGYLLTLPQPEPLN